MKSWIRLAALGAVALCLTAAMSSAPAFAAFPEKPVKIVVPFPPGGGSDTLARILSKRLSEMWGQGVVIENKGGAQGSIGTAYGLKQPADGYTVTLVVQGALALNPHMYGKDNGFDAITDLVAVVRATEQSYVMVSRTGLPLKDLKAVVEMAREKPGKLTLGTSASGPQLVGELFKMTTGTNMLHVPYKGGGPASLAIIAGEVDLMISNPTGVIQQIKAGKVHPIAVLGSERIALIPDVPSALEQGFPALSDIPEWYGFVVPAGTPKAIVDKLNADFVAVLKDPEVQKSIRSNGTTPSPSTPEEFGRQIAADYERWGKVVRASGVKPE